MNCEDNKETSCNRGLCDRYYSVNGRKVTEEYYREWLKQMRDWFGPHQMEPTHVEEDEGYDSDYINELILENRDLKSENRKLLKEISSLNTRVKELSEELMDNSELEFYLSVIPRFLNGVGINPSDVRTQGDLVRVLKNLTDEYLNLKSKGEGCENEDPESLDPQPEGEEKDMTSTSGWVEFKSEKPTHKCDEGGKCDNESKTFLSDTIKSLQSRVAAIEAESKKSKMDGVPFYASVGHSGRPEVGSKVTPQDYRPGVNEPLLNGVREILSQTFKYIDPKIMDEMIKIWNDSRENK